MRFKYSVRVLGRANLTLPQNDNAPSEFGQAGIVRCIAKHIFGELSLPESHIGFWNRSPLAPGMTVPKTAVDKHNGLPLS